MVTLHSCPKGVEQLHSCSAGLLKIKMMPPEHLLFLFWMLKIGGRKIISLLESAAQCDCPMLLVLKCAHVQYMSKQLYECFNLCLNLLFWINTIMLVWMGFYSDQAHQRKVWWIYMHYSLQELLKYKALVKMIDSILLIVFDWSLRLLESSRLHPLWNNKKTLPFK